VGMSEPKPANDVPDLGVFGYQCRYGTDRDLRNPRASTETVFDRINRCLPESQQGSIQCLHIQELDLPTSTRGRKRVNRSSFYACESERSEDHSEIGTDFEGQSDGTNRPRPIYTAVFIL
jgi:hypothetical protein